MTGQQNSKTIQILSVLFEKGSLNALYQMLKLYLASFTLDEQIALTIFPLDLELNENVLLTTINSLGYDCETIPDIVVVSGGDSDSLSQAFQQSNIFLNSADEESFAMIQEFIPIGPQQKLSLFPLKDSRFKAITAEQGQEELKTIYQELLHQQQVPLQARPDQAQQALNSDGLQEAYEAYSQQNYSQALTLANTFCEHNLNLANFEQMSVLIQIFKAVGESKKAKEIFKKAKEKLFTIELSLQELIDPTLIPPYTPEIIAQEWDTINQTYQQAFRRCFEYLRATRVAGDILEFGTFRGYTARILAQLIHSFGLDSHLYLFDSFQGLPAMTNPMDKNSYEVKKHGTWFQGLFEINSYTQARIAEALNGILDSGQIHITKGFFEDILPSYSFPKSVALAHIDCDLYSSTKTVLEQLLNQDVLQDGSVLLFDDFNCNKASPDMGQKKALLDVFNQVRNYSYSLFFSYGWHGQAFFVHRAE